MNPFDFTGPAFLGFYWVCVLPAVLFGAWLLRRLVEQGEIPELDLSNPYLLAYLRGGKEQVVQLVVVSLVDRGLILTERGMLAVRDDQVAHSVRSPLERSALIRLRQVQPASPDKLLRDPFLDASCEGLARELRERGLLASERLRGHRLLIYLLSVLILGGVALAKIVIAVGRGRHNIGFLILSAVIACALPRLWANPRLTVLGRRVISDMYELFGGLRARADTIAPGGGTAELALLVGVFGIAALPNQVFPHKALLFPAPAPEPLGAVWGSSDSNGSTCSSGGSSCSSGSSCGSSCGGGGGCGGCGS